MSAIVSNGGGATHIAKRTGQLKDLSSYTSDILLVSGGGGGGLLVGETATQGQNAGGISGSGTNSGNQSTGYAFGQGESGTNVSGGGAGLYGGNKGTSSISGGAGSGYIGNSLVSNKKMVGYNVPTSSDASTKTESVSVYSATGEADKPKAGNGKAKIKFLSEYPPSSWRRVTTLLDKENIIIDTQFHDSIVQYTQSTNKWTWFKYTGDGSYRLNNTGGSNARAFFNMGFVKYKATKLYIDAEADKYGSGSYPDFYLSFFKADPGNYAYSENVYFQPYMVSWYSQENYNQSSPFYTLQRTLMEFDFSQENIKPNDIIYLSFNVCDESAKIYKIYFDDEIAVVPSS